MSCIYGRYKNLILIRIIFIYNNDIAAVRVELWSSSTNAKYAESSSTSYILCKKQIKV